MSESTLRRTSHGRPADEELALELQPSGSNEKPPKPLSRTHSRMGQRFFRKGKTKVGVVDSLKALVFSSWLNILLLFIPIAWVAHFANKHDSPPEKTFPFSVTFVFCFLAIIPLEKLFEYGGEQMAFYVGPDLGELLVVTLNNVVEGTLAIILLKKCELKLLQSTIIGVVLLHLLLIPGVAFVTGGARIIEQDLHPHLTQLNQTLLTIGVMALLLPAAFFAALDQGIISGAPADAATQGRSNFTDGFLIEKNRVIFLQMSRGIAILLLLVYVCSRIFLYNPPGEHMELAEHRLAPEALKDKAAEFEQLDPEVSQWVCIAMLAVTIGIMAATAEWLVDSIDFIGHGHSIQREWFGLILLPLVSFSGDGFLAILFFVRSWIRHLRGMPSPPGTLASARPIDLSIQFILFWMPFIVLLGWWTGRPLFLLFDIFEVALVISSCFVVNYVTADSKTNWAEGVAMLSFYAMIALTAWFYTGQTQIDIFLQCQSVADAFAAAISGGGDV